MKLNISISVLINIEDFLTEKNLRHFEHPSGAAQSTEFRISQKNTF